jgi:hypothetical protein
MLYFIDSRTFSPVAKNLSVYISQEKRKKKELMMANRKELLTRGRGQIDPIDEDDEEEKDELIIVLSAQELGGDVLCMFIMYSY